MRPDPKLFRSFFLDLVKMNVEQKMCKLAKYMERKSRDLNQGTCIKDEEGKVLVIDQDVKERWRTIL